MKNYIAILPLLLLLLASCSEEDVTPAEPQTPTESPDAVYIQARLGAVTYAATDLSPIEDEKQMKSVAFFVEGENGELYKFFSEEPLQSANGFEAASQDASGNYTGITLKLEHGIHLGTTKVAVLANYHHYDSRLATALAAVESMDHLLALKANTPANKLETPLLMYDQCILKIVSGQVTLWDGNPFNGIFNMKRLAARIEFDTTIAINNGGGWGDIPQVDDLIAAGRLECFALLYNPKAETYLFPGGGDINLLPSMERFSEKFPSQKGKISFYIYETTGYETEPLEVYIICRHQPTENGPWVESMSSVVPVGNDSKLPLFKRNHAYAMPSVSFDLTVTDWDEAEWLSNKSM